MENDGIAGVCHGAKKEFVDGTTALSGTMRFVKKQHGKPAFNTEHQEITHSLSSNALLHHTFDVGASGNLPFLSSTRSYP